MINQWFGALDLLPMLVNNKNMIVIKRVYEPASKEDGYRILVDRLWPRGLTKEKVAADVWLKELAPSAQLRKWYGHDPEKWKEFNVRYAKELADKKELLKEIVTRGSNGKVTLLYAAKDELHNQGVALRDYISKHTKGR